MHTALQPSKHHLLENTVLLPTELPPHLFQPQLVKTVRVLIWNTITLEYISNSGKGNPPISFFFFSFNFFKIFIYLFLERWKGKDKEKDRNINVWLPLACPLLGNLACHPGVCPDWESNLRPFGSQPTLSPLSYTSQGQFCSFSK